MPQIKGTAVAPGLALGPVHVVRARADAVPMWTVPGEHVELEIARLEDAVALAQAQFARQQELVREAAGEQDAGIFAVHRMILQDPGALQRVERQVRDERINAEAAVQGLIDHLHVTMGRLDGDSVRSYADDVSDPWRVVLDVLMARDREQVSAGGARVVLAAAELTPQVVTFIERERILGIVTETGGRFSHGAVLARSFGIPCVVGLPNLLARLEQDMPVLVDGDNGTVALRPDAAAAVVFVERRARRAAGRAALAHEAALPATTPDGTTLSVEVNLESIRDLGTFEREHADGVGLLRTEFLYMERSQFPSEEEQYRLYRRVVDHMQGKSVTFRTLDIGGDKELPYFKTPAESNPALGWRGLRVSLEWQDLLRVQLRAILRASAHGSARLLLPMVTSIEEVLAVRKVFFGVRDQLIEQGYEVADELPVGIMIEVPSSIWSLPEIAPEVDFVSVGTNDLTQYLLAVDRDNPLVAKIYDPHHPAVVRALAQVAQVCRAAGKPCSVCGEIAGDAATMLGLLGMGYDAVSVAPNFLAELRFAVRRTTHARARELATALVSARNSSEVREQLTGMRRELHAERAR
jgi:phosphoenolpyruvate-protein phosphotransferase